MIQDASAQTKKKRKAHVKPDSVFSFNGFTGPLSEICEREGVSLKRILSSINYDGVSLASSIEIIRHKSLSPDNAEPFTIRADLSPILQFILSLNSNLGASDPVWRYGNCVKDTVRAYEEDRALCPILCYEGGKIIAYIIVQRNGFMYGYIDRDGTMEKTVAMYEKNLDCVAAYFYGAFDKNKKLNPVFPDESEVITSYESFCEFVSLVPN